MKKLFFVILVCGFTISFLSISMADTISIVADNWCPYNCVPNDSEPGYGIEIAKRAFESAGHSIEYKIVPWARAVQETRKGKYNAIIGAYKEDAPDFIFPTEEVGISQNVFFIKKGNPWRFNGVNSLSGMKIGLIKDYSYGEELDKFFKINKNLIQYVAGERALSLNIKKLLKGRIDIFIEDPNVFFLKAKKMNLGNQIITGGNTGTGENLYIAFSPKIVKSKKYAEILSVGIIKLKNSGELKKIMKKYGLNYWK